MLSIENLQFGYDKNYNVLENVSLNVGKGELFGIFGPNGTGKSTLFKCIIGFLKPKKGSIYINDTDLLNLPTEEIAKLISYVPQEHKPPFPYLVKDIVLMGRTPHLGGVFGPGENDLKKASEALSTIGVEHLANRPYTDLSGGQRQLVLLARALSQETKIMILDEPTSALDFKNQVKIWNILKKLTQKGISVIVSVHDPNHMLWYCDNIAILNKGKILATGKPEKILTENILNELYGEICDIKEYGDLKFVIPKIIFD